MKSLDLTTIVRVCLLMSSLLFAPLTLSVLAQNTSTTQGGSGSSSQTTTTTTSAPSAPSQTTHTQTTTTVDPIWFVIGGVVVLAIILIAIFASRGRSRGQVDVVQERETVVKKD